MIRIVVVDDNEQTQALLRNLCLERNWTAISCRSGVNAFDRIKEEQPALVFLDIWLEHKTSGWEILQHLKASPETRHIPVVVCSAGREDLQDHRELIENLAVAVLVKPFSIEDVERCLDFALASTAELGTS